VPTVLGEDGHKLSKRHGAVSVMQYEELGYLPEAMVNFLAHLGWGHGDDEIFTRNEFVSWFDFDAIHPAPARFDTQKLKWVNQEHMKRLPEIDLGQRLVPYLVRAGLKPDAGPAPGPVAILLRDRVATLAGMADAAHYFYLTPHPSSEAIAEFVNDGNRAALTEVAKEMATVEWKREAIGALIKAVAAKHKLKPPQIMMALRMLACGTRETPAIDAVIALLGRETVRARIAAGLARLN